VIWTLFKTKEELDDYLDQRAHEIRERIFYEHIGESGYNIIRIQKMIDEEIARDRFKILQVAELERPGERSRRVKLKDLRRGSTDRMYLDDEDWFH
jgi:hypothetical protein